MMEHLNGRILRMGRNQSFEVRGIDAVIFRLEQEYHDKTKDKDPFLRDWKKFKTIRIEQKTNGLRTITYKPLSDAEKAQLSTRAEQEEYLLNKNKYVLKHLMEKYDINTINRYIDSCKYRDKLIEYMEEKLNAETTQSFEGSC